MKQAGVFVLFPVARRRNIMEEIWQELLTIHVTLPKIHQLRPIAVQLCGYVACDWLIRHHFRSGAKVGNTDGLYLTVHLNHVPSYVQYLCTACPYIYSSLTRFPQRTQKRLNEQY